MVLLFSSQGILYRQRAENAIFFTLTQRIFELLRRSKQLLRAAKLRFGRLSAAGEPRQLRAALRAVQLRDTSEGAAVLLAFLDGKMRIRHRGKLWKMRNTEHLPLLRELCKLFRHALGRAS